MGNNTDLELLENVSSGISLTFHFGFVFNVCGAATERNSILVDFYNGFETKKVERNANPEWDPSDFAEAVFVFLQCFAAVHVSRNFYPKSLIDPDF